MSSAFLDTSVLVRYLVEDSGEIWETAKKIVDESPRLIVSELVLNETAYVLSSVYEVPRSSIVDSLAELIVRRNIVLLHLSKEAALEALNLCRPSRRVSFVDAFVWAQARAARAPVVTFDRRFPDQDVEVVGGPPD